MSLSSSEKVKRNAARLKRCELHRFEPEKDLLRAKKRREEAGVYIPVPLRTYVICRCKNCGGKMLWLYAAPYMDGVRASKKQGGHYGENE